MTGEPMVTMTGRLANTPVIREIRNGNVVCNFTIASTPSRYDASIQGWKDEETMFLRISCWQQMARNAAASLRKGDPVVVHGKFSIRRYEADGQQRESHEIRANSIGPNLQFGQAVFTRTTGSQPATQPLGEGEQAGDARPEPDQQAA
jgi:single-strand DNA-binding protein